MYILKILTFQHILFKKFSDQNTNPSPRTGPQDFLVTQYDCEENEQKTLQKYALKSSITMRNKTTSYRNYNCNSNIVLKSPSNNSHRI